MFRRSRSDRAIVALLMVMLAGCAAKPEIPLPPTGTMADIVARGRSFRNLELLAMQEDTLYVWGDEFMAIPCDSVRTVSLRISEDRSWMYFVILGEIVPATVMMFFEDGTPQLIGAVVGAMGISSWVAFEFSSPQSTFKFPLEQTEREDFSLYLRFPYGVRRNVLDQVALLARRGGR